ncbi:hypothetical protein, partial [Komagataeibacter kakiaceti]|uniref:hypothetical protein n=1 Tax=Komagataeibacter kakiaceti TaxID=943261 RepID=UPI001A7E8095
EAPPAVAGRPGCGTGDGVGVGGWASAGLRRLNNVTPLGYAAPEREVFRLDGGYAFGLVAGCCPMTGYTRPDHADKGVNGKCRENIIQCAHCAG